MIRYQTDGFKSDTFANCQEWCLMTEGCGYFTWVGGNNFGGKGYYHHCYVFDETIGCPEIADEFVDGDRTCEDLGCNTGVPCTNV